jgi:hypothetical protein
MCPNPAEVITCLNTSGRLKSISHHAPDEPLWEFHHRQHLDTGRASSGGSGGVRVGIGTLVAHPGTRHVLVHDQHLPRLGSRWLRSVYIEWHGSCADLDCFGLHLLPI